MNMKDMMSALGLRGAIVVLALLLGFGVMAGSSTAAPKMPEVKIETSMGDIVVELDTEKAPETVRNFLYYVKSGFYNDTVFHRVINGFMIQGGGLTADMKTKANSRKPIRNEADNGLSNKKYTIAMARTQDPHSATSQFFINVADNAALDYREKSTAGYGYAVFGRVIKGQDVVDKIKMVATGRSGMHADVPLTPVVIKAVVPVSN